MSRSFATQADAAGKAVVMLEMGESKHVSKDRVDLGVTAVHNALKVLEMESREPKVAREPRKFSHIALIHTRHGGGLRVDVEIGDEVTAGDPLGVVTDVFGDTIEELTAPSDGFVMRVMRYAAVNSGAEAVWIAS
jgi:predicted deacylase